MPKLVSRTWRWEFDRPASSIWPILADTARFNEAADFPLHRPREEVQPDGSVRFFTETRMGAVAVAWEDIPTNWVEGRWFRHDRVLSQGPFAAMNAHFVLKDTPTGCQGDYTLEVAPANLLGRLLLACGFFRQVREKFGRLAEQANEHVVGRRILPFDFAPPVLAEGGSERVRRLVLELERGPYAHGLAERLGRWLLERPDADMWTIRPLRLARLWGVPPRHAIELCLAAASGGLLSMRWDLICPRCRVGKAPCGSMDEIPTGTHCDACNIDYQRNFTRNVELAFYPSRTIRPLGEGEYCLFDPMSTPHIKAQIRLAPGETRREAATLEPGHYRFRSLEPGGERLVEWRDGHFPAFVIQPDGGIGSAPDRGHDGELTLVNQSGSTRTLVVEERLWMRDILTAHEAAGLQCFRDLFSDQVLRAGDFVEIDRIVLMFSDVLGSTRMYENIGDAEAYALVREHFALLARTVRARNGTVVKTIGDAIMAAFVSPSDAVAAALDIQRDFHAFNESQSEGQEVVVRLGLHLGSCISVTLNGTLDYYGQTANLCARLAALSAGADIVLSRELARDPAVEGLLRGYTLSPEETSVRGISRPISSFRLHGDEIVARVDPAT